MKAGTISGQEVYEMFRNIRLRYGFWVELWRDLDEAEALAWSILAAKMRAAQLGKKRTPEAREKIRAAWTPERRARLSAAMKGQAEREESK